jgi:siroheme synthase
MKRLLVSKLLMLALLWSGLWSVPTSVEAKGDDFGAVLKVVEEFYGVKHQGIPFLAKAGIKTATAVARLAGGSKKKLAEAGSVKVAFFEGQEFKSKGSIADFRASLKATLVGRWLPFIQVLSLNEGAQTYVFLRDAGPKYTVLVVTIEEHDAAVVQVNLAPQTLAMLMQNPNEMGKAITDDATKNDDQE